MTTGNTNPHHTTPRSAGRPSRKNAPSHAGASHPSRVAASSEEPDDRERRQRRRALRRSTGSSVGCPLVDLLQDPFVRRDADRVAPHAEPERVHERGQRAPTLRRRASSCCRARRDPDGPRATREPISDGASTGSSRARSPRRASSEREHHSRRGWARRPARIQSVPVNSGYADHLRPHPGVRRATPEAGDAQERDARPRRRPARPAREPEEPERRTDASAAHGGRDRRSTRRSDRSRPGAPARPIAGSSHGAPGTVNVNDVGARQGVRREHGVARPEVIREVGRVHRPRSATITAIGERR